MKRRHKFNLILLTMITILLISACSNNKTKSDASVTTSTPSGQIYLYGESHGVEEILNKEVELWYDYYHNENMRHLFIEMPYYTAEFLNIWMQSDSNDILDLVYSGWIGTAAYNPNVKEFYEKIKSQCPETIFHGTDVGHQYDTTGEQFLEYLETNNLEDSEQYQVTEEVIKQGKRYYRLNIESYRENMMVENFIREYDKLSGESIMGIYGASHTDPEGLNYTRTVKSMAYQLKEHYGDIIHSEDLSGIAKDIEPYRVDTIQFNGKDYEASYFGKQDLSHRDYSYREFWRLENAYDDFADNPKTRDVLPYNNYPMLIEKGQVFVIDYTKKDGSVERKYYRADGNEWKGLQTTEEFKIK